MTASKVTVTRGSVPLGAFPLVNAGPTEYALRIYQGDTFTRTFAFTDSTGSAVALQGVWVAQVRQSPGAATPLASFAVDSSQLAGGIVTISLDTLTTAELTAGAWDLQETDTNGTVTTWLSGTVTVTLDVSR